MASLRCAAKLVPFLSLDCAPRPPPWRNPRKGRDQILPSGNLAPRITPPSCGALPRPTLITNTKLATGVSALPTADLQPLQSAPPHRQQLLDAPVEETTLTGACPRAIRRQRVGCSRWSGARMPIRETSGGKWGCHYLTTQCISAAAALYSTTNGSYLRPIAPKEHSSSNIFFLLNVQFKQKDIYEKVM